jgi:hypothetical protein
VGGGGDEAIARIKAAARRIQQTANRIVETLALATPTGLAA